MKIATVSRRLAAIAEQHHGKGSPSPADEWVVRKTLRRLRCEHGVPARGKAPLLTADIGSMVAATPDRLAGTRDRAILLLGFAGVMRRRELVSLDVEDLALAPEGLAQAAPALEHGDRLHRHVHFDARARDGQRRPAGEPEHPFAFRAQPHDALPIAGPQQDEVRA